MHAMNAAGQIAEAIGGSRWLRGYVRGKLSHDPVFEEARRALADCRGPVVDLGCGLGLLGFWLRAHGCACPYAGCDLSGWKIETGRAAAALRGEREWRMEVADITAFPLGGAAAICAFDVIHYLDPEKRGHLTTGLAAAARAGAKVYLRTGVRGCGWRSALTLAEEIWTRWSGWIRGGRVDFPDLAAVCGAFEQSGCRIAEARPLWGRTPFSSYWIEVTAD